MTSEYGIRETQIVEIFPDLSNLILINIIIDCILLYLQSISEPLLGYV